MSIYEFIKQNKDRILNIDGGDDGNITLKGDNGCLEFYYFKDGECVDMLPGRVNWAEYKIEKGDLPL
jgi:hypothetical protein